MQYRDIEKFGVTLISVHDSQDYYHTFANIVLGEVPKSHVLVRLDNGIHDGERKNIILARNRDNVGVFIQCDASPPEMKDFNCFVLTKVGHSIDLVWSKRFSTWFIVGSESICLDDWEYNRWIQDPISVDINC